MTSSSRVFGNYCRTLMAAAKSSTEAPATAANATSAAAGKGRTRGILKPLPISPALGKFVGASEISRTDAVKKVWDYIKTNNLQNPANKKEINCDAKLKTIFAGKDKVGFLEIAKLLSSHFQKAS
ncbi:putative ABC transporter G family member 14-like isoform X1 [Capsicum annuum]|uniref:upstream activation factor subunit UAF30 n=1 Tax=Capsicum annuum TaxID=4072 RepID=UPI0007BF2DCA|nr:upstream activation factor subunit UAF30 [Capsicum annuum]KAF3657005.1 putative ABC transporter G family member 14-like isoform X1 [Capsicum annuum]KAF3678973.1 putative ABC transporter G family member 14-like isoform X1 [Capsicum annuum]